jgi:hypothetical protein
VEAMNRYRAKGNANADDDAQASKPFTGNLYARFEEGNGGNSSAPTLPLPVRLALRSLLLPLVWRWTFNVQCSMFDHPKILAFVTS